MFKKQSVVILLFPLLFCYWRDIFYQVLDFDGLKIITNVKNSNESDPGFVSIDPNFELGASRAGQELELRRLPRGSLLRQVAKVDQRQETPEVKVEVRSRQHHQQQQQQKQERN